MCVCVRVHSHGKTCWDYFLVCLAYYNIPYVCVCMEKLSYCYTNTNGHLAVWGLVLWNPRYGTPWDSQPRGHALPENQKSRRYALYLKVLYGAHDLNFMVSYGFLASNSAYTKRRIKSHGGQDYHHGSVHNPQNHLSNKFIIPCIRTS